MIDCLKLQLKTQMEGLEKVSQFTIQEIGLSKEYFQLSKDSHQTLARVSLAVDWLQKDLAIFMGEVSGQSKLSQLLQQLLEKKIEVRANAMQKEGRERERERERERDVNNRSSLFRTPWTESVHTEVPSFFKGLE